MKKIVLFVLFLLFPAFVSARSRTDCDYILLSKLKKLVSNVNITYVYKEIDDKILFDITLTNIPYDSYFIDSISGNTYYYDNTNDGIITLTDFSSGNVSFSFYSNNIDCLNEKLVVRNVSLPYYNYLYNSSECEGIEDYSLCQKWIKGNYNYYDYLYSIEKYKEQLKSDKVEIINEESINWFDKIIDLFLSYYYIFMPLIIILIVGIVYLVKMIKFRKNRFKI